MSKITDEVTRPIIGIENRTGQEVFDIMADRFRALRSKSEAVAWAGLTAETVIGKYTVSKDWDGLWHFGLDDFVSNRDFDSEEDAKKAAAKHFSIQVSALTHPAPATVVSPFVTEANGLEVATIKHDDFSLIEVVKSRSGKNRVQMTIHRTNEETLRTDDISIDLTDEEATALVAALTEEGA